MSKLIQYPSKHYSPLRYPGGKSSLACFFSSLIETNKITDCIYVEPFAGGAGAALNLLFLEKVDSIIINDLDRAIFSFWKSILRDSRRFIEKIKSTDITIDEWYRQKEIYNNSKASTLDLGFSTFFLNRTNRSGIIEGGPIGGIKQKGNWLIDARFNKPELINRIKNIASYESRIMIFNKDGIDLLKDITIENNHFIYLDPPYYIKGSSLYLNHYIHENHIRLAEFLNSSNDLNWVLTYDNVEEIKNLYNSRRFFDFKLNYHIDLPKLGKEILVLSDKIIVN
jgi:DNA adenine methylase